MDMMDGWMNISQTTGNTRAPNRMIQEYFQQAADLAYDEAFADEEEELIEEETVEDAKKISCISGCCTS